MLHLFIVLEIMNWILPMWTALPLSVLSLFLHHFGKRYFGVELICPTYLMCQLSILTREVVTLLELVQHTFTCSLNVLVYFNNYEFCRLLLCLSPLFTRTYNYVLGALNCIFYCLTNLGLNISFKALEYSAIISSWVFWKHYHFLLFTVEASK